jgi:hypothetical protein
LAAEYTLLNTVFTTPLDEDLLLRHSGSRMKRLDELDEGFSPVDQASWSPSGSVAE